MTTWRIGTRGSQLALWQAGTVAGVLESAGHSTRLVIIRTTGDRLQERPLSEVGGKRLFVKEIEEALLSKHVDLAVHSTKDVPADLMPGLTIGAFLPREDPRDAVVLSSGAARIESIDHLRERLGSKARIGTSSVRRVGQLTRLLPGASFEPIRGNLDTRLRKLDAAEYDALVLAAAGLTRLGFAARISFPLGLDECVPAPGQGAIAIECREADRDLAAVLAAVSHGDTAEAVAIERTLVAALGGGCETPVGAITVFDGSDVDLRAIVTSPDGSEVLARRDRAPRAHGLDLATRLARDFVKAGALRLLGASEA